MKFEDKDIAQLLKATDSFYNTYFYALDYQYMTDDVSPESMTINNLRAMVQYALFGNINAYKNALNCLNELKNFKTNDKNYYARIDKLTQLVKHAQAMELKNFRTKEPHDQPTSHQHVNIDDVPF